MLGEVQQHGSVSRHILHQRTDDARRIHVFLSGLVVPLRDAGFRLERIGHDLWFNDGFGALDQGAIDPGKEVWGSLEAVVAASDALEIDDRFHSSMVPPQGFVVEICNQWRSKKTQPHVYAQVYLGSRPRGSSK